MVLSIINAIFADITGSTREIIPNYFEVEKTLKNYKEIEKRESLSGDDLHDSEISPWFLKKW